MNPNEVPTGIDENVIDIDGTMVQTWLLHNDPARIEDLRPVEGVVDFMRESSQINTCLSHGKRGELFQLDKIERFDLRRRFEQHNGGGGIYICERSEDKKDRLQEIVMRFCRRHHHQDLRRLAVIGNNTQCELQYGIEIGATVIRIRNPADPHAQFDLVGSHYVVGDWYELMALPFYRPYFEHVLARRA